VHLLIGPPPTLKGKTSFPSTSLVEIDPALFNTESNHEPMRGATIRPEYRPPLPAA